VPDALEHRVGAVATGELADLLDALLAACGDDVGGTPLATKVGAVGVPAHEDDLLGAQPAGGQHGGQPHGPVADDGHGRVGPDLGDRGGVVAGRKHVREGQQARQQLGVLGDRRPHQRPGGLRHAGRLGLGGGEEPTLRARGVQALSAGLARVVGVGERRDHDVTDRQPGHVAAELLDDAHELVAHGLALVTGRGGAVGVQVGAADARPQHADDGIRGLLDRGVGDVLDADVAGAVQQGGSHVGAFARGAGAGRCSSRGVATRNQ
jgi:hypothetical protein